MNLPEPVTLDFLDAEVEDSNKEEVSTKFNFHFPLLSVVYVQSYYWASEQPYLPEDDLPTSLQWCVEVAEGPRNIYASNITATGSFL